MAAIISDVVIVSKTRMANNNICVGAYDLAHDRMLRLLSHEARALTDDYPYEIGQSYSIKYQDRYEVFAPHTEDVAVYEFQEIPPEDNHDMDLITSDWAVDCNDLSDLFNNKLCWENESGFIEEHNNINFSVQIATLDQELYKEGNYYTQKKFGLTIKKVKYVGYLDIRFMPEIIQSNTKIRFSLARLWDKNDDGNRRAYLQLSGIYN